MKAVVEKLALIALAALFEQADAAQTVAFETACRSDYRRCRSGCPGHGTCPDEIPPDVLASRASPFTAAFEHAVLELADEPAAIAVVQASRP